MLLNFVDLCQSIHSIDVALYIYTYNELLVFVIVLSIMLLLQIIIIIAHTDEYEIECNSLFVVLLLPNIWHL